MPLYINFCLACFASDELHLKNLTMPLHRSVVAYLDEVLQVMLRSGQFEGEVRFRIDEVQNTVVDSKENGRAPSPILEKNDWGTYAKGALYALQQEGMKLTLGIKGMISGSECLDSTGLSSSTAVGVAYLLALESANGLTILPDVNIELDRLIENEYLGLKNGILDQSAILLSSHGCLTWMNYKSPSSQDFATLQSNVSHLTSIVEDQQNQTQTQHDRIALLQSMLMQIVKYEKQEQLLVNFEIPTSSPNLPFYRALVMTSWGEMGSSIDAME
ncbi:hypothetical protein Sjap_013227 [Stephania japonica]|uniref:GHMP kinase N-terminal domain-containing protein n=1 Tax=Stephania japonica TaxID=461633 RepID=A0AAP0NZN8_9MAGN